MINNKIQKQNFDPDAFKTCIFKKQGQLQDIISWTEANSDYRIQVNFCIPGEANHVVACVSGVASTYLAEQVIKAMKSQISAMNNRLTQFYDSRNNRTEC